jgi:hypothetical protein
MNTNQMMTIQIGKNYTVQIGHLTQIGKLNDVLEIGNIYREKRGLRKVELQDWLRLESTWEYIAVRSKTKEIPNYFKSAVAPELDFTLIKDIYNKVDYPQMMKKYKNVIFSKRGKYGGTWADLRIMLDLANYLDPVLKDEMYEIFINKKILFWRDLGGDSFKEFNKIVDTLPDRVGQKNRGIYIQVATKIRKKLEILETKGYNEKEHNALIQENRTEWLKSLTFAVKVGFIKSYEDLKNTLDKLEVLESL